MLGLTALLALILASSAAANWTHKGKGELKENASVTLSGELTLSTSAGNVSCPVSMGTTLTASGSSGHVNSFTVSKPSECDLTGSLAAICGTNGLTKVEKTGTWALTADESDITLSAIDVHYTMAGCLIPSFRLKGSSTLSLDKSTAIGKATFSGTQTLYNSAGEESGTGELKGTLTASPAGTYGVKTGALVETVWTDEDKHLSSDGKLTLTGTFSFSGSGGSISCPATIKLLLESSTVEEEEAEGEIESFTVANPSECDAEGGYKTSCGTSKVVKVEQTGTATLTATESAIKVSGLALDYEFKECGIVTLRVEGSPTLTPGNPESIAGATFSVGSLEVFNSKAETIGTASAGGEVSASPSGTFQLTEDHGEHEKTTEEAETAHTEATETEETAHTEHTEETAETPGGLTLIEGQWRIDPGEEPVEAHTVELTGSISSTKAPIRNGPCEVHVQMTIFSEEEGGATAEIESYQITTPAPGCQIFINVGGGVYAPVTGCFITAMSTAGFPWHIDVEEGATGIAITGAYFTNEYNGCGALGIPNGAMLSAEGTATGTWDNNGGCIRFNNDGDLTAGGAAVSTDGSICN